MVLFYGMIEGSEACLLMVVRWSLLHTGPTEAPESTTAKTRRAATSEFPPDSSSNFTNGGHTTAMRNTVPHSLIGGMQPLWNSGNFAGPQNTRTEGHCHVKKKFFHHFFVHVPVGVGPFFLYHLGLSFSFYGNHQQEPQT